MTEPSSSKITPPKSPQTNDYKDKRMLYELLYDIKSVIQGKPININKEEFEHNLLSINISQLISYLKEFIPILINSLKKESPQLHSHPPLTSLPEQYQKRLLKLEQNERKYVKHIFQQRLLRESLELRIAEYIQMEEDFEEMRLKFRYEEGKFLSNDRKDNEIIILRNENSNLKQEIISLETNIKTLQKEIPDYKDKLVHQTQTTSELKQLLEEKQKELTYISNINTNIHNFTHSGGGATLTSNSNHVNTTSYLYNTNTHNNELSTLERVLVSESKFNDEKMSKEKMYYSQLPHKLIKNRFNNDGNRKVIRNGSTGRKQNDFVSHFNMGPLKKNFVNQISIGESTKMRLKGNKSASNLMDLTQYPVISKGRLVHYRNGNFPKNLKGLGILRKNNEK